MWKATKIMNSTSNVISATNLLICRPSKDTSKQTDGIFNIFNPSKRRDGITRLPELPSIFKPVGCDTPEQGGYTGMMKKKHTDSLLCYLA